MSNPLVTVVIPVYNVENYLRECLDSVCNQSYRRLEIICVDDGSTDESFSILDEYAKRDDRVIVLTQLNAGAAAARNAAMRIAKGEWICAVDSDDYLDLHAIEKCMQHAQKDVDVIHLNARMFQEDNGETLSTNLFDMSVSGKTKVTDTLIPEITPFVWDKLWRRDFVERVGFLFPEGVIFEDMCFTWCVLSLADNIYCLRDRLYHYRKRLGSTMGSLGKNQASPKILDYLKISEICLSFWKQHNIREKYGYTGPSYIELAILEHCCDRISQWGADEFQYQAWKGICSLIRRFELGERLPEFPLLASYVQLPPFARGFIRMETFLLSKSWRIYWMYRLSLLICFLTWGEKRRRYRAKANMYHKFVRRLRNLKREAWQQLEVMDKVMP